MWLCSANLASCWLAHLTRVCTQTRVIQRAQVANFVSSVLQISLLWHSVFCSVKKIKRSHASIVCPNSTLGARATCNALSYCSIYRSVVLAGTQGPFAQDRRPNPLSADPSSPPSPSPPANPPRPAANPSQGSVDESQPSQHPSIPSQSLPPAVSASAPVLTSSLSLTFGSLSLSEVGKRAELQPVGFVQPSPPQRELTGHIAGFPGQGPSAGHPEPAAHASGQLGAASPAGNARQQLPSAPFQGHASGHSKAPPGPALGNVSSQADTGPSQSSSTASRAAGVLPEAFGSAAASASGQLPAQLPQPQASESAPVSPLQARADSAASTSSPEVPSHEGGRINLGFLFSFQ